MAPHAHPRVLATALALASPCAALPQSPPQEVSKLEITGSRVKRADVEGALPVTTITRQDIEASGQATVAELIRDSPFTTTGNFRPQSGFSNQGVSEVNLRGLGGRRTLVLVDGHRIAKAAMGNGEYVDMNSIPLAAVERIEILTDGASAIYGSDALGGVVNIILRKNFEGVALTFGQTRVSSPIDGGDRAEASAVLGMVTDKGRILMGASATDREIIFTRDAYYTAGATGASQLSNNYLREWGEFIAPVPGGCTNPNFFLRGGRCRYDFTRVAADEAALAARGFFARGEYSVSSEWTAFFASSVSRVTSFGRYAPVPGNVVIEPGSFAHPWHPSYPDPSLRERVGPDETILLSHRFAAGGTRDTVQETAVYDTLIGAKGRLWGADAEAGLRKSTSKAAETGRGFVIEPLAREAIRTGAYDIFDPVSTPRAVLDSFTHTTSRDGLFDSTEQYLNATFDVLELAGGPARLFLGAEHRKEAYEDIYDSLMEGGVVLGSGGNSASGKRDVTAIGGELVLPLSRKLEVALAARREDYSDYGNDTSPKLSFRYQPDRSIVLRGSLGRGFAAPALWQSNAKPAWTAAGVVDLTHCLADGNTREFCEAGNFVSVNTYIIANPELTAEHSTHLSFGGAWDAASFLSVKADFWKTRVEDIIVFLGPQEIADRDAGRSLLPIPSPLGITRDASGFITEIRAGYTNEGTLEQSGVDASVVVSASLGRYGQWRSELTWSRVFAIDNNGVRLEGDFYWPIDRAVLANRWMIGPFDAAWNVKMIGKHGDDRIGHAGSYITHDVQLAWAAPLKGLKVVVGAINVTAKMPPPVGGGSRAFDFWLYDGYGRQAYARLEMRF
ncbi:MAG: TonB-dependent receptor [Burkholderiales bacterium]|nr:TonB-dependent receptor [Burkholderiales bacterium]